MRQVLMVLEIVADVIAIYEKMSKNDNENA